MALPKTRKPLADRTNRSKIEQAFRLAGTMQTPGVSPEEGAARRIEMTAVEIPEAHRTAKSPMRPAPETVRLPAAEAVLPAVPPSMPELPATPLSAVPAKRIGRPPLKEDRTERVSAWVSEGTRDRLRLAMYGENVRTKGKTDQSLIIEDALEAWLERHGY